MANSGARDHLDLMPPAGWKARVLSGRYLPKDGGTTQVAEIGGKLVPSEFMLYVEPAGMDDVNIVVHYEVVEGELTNPTLATTGIDAVRAADVLRKGLPLEAWGQYAVNFISMQLLIEQVTRLGDAPALAALLRIPVADAREKLAGLEAAGSDDAGWASAVAAARSRYDEVGSRFLLGEVPARHSKRRNGITKEHLQAVAGEYRRAVAAGEPPTKAVAARFDASHSTAARWVKLARDAGELGVTSRGRSGEGSSPAEEG